MFDLYFNLLFCIYSSLSYYIIVIAFQFIFTTKKDHIGAKLLEYNHMEGQLQENEVIVHWINKKTILLYYILQMQESEKFSKIVTILK